MKILVIEDNPRLAERIKSTLGKLYLTDVALTGEEGLHQGSTIDYNIIILDLGLPDMHGLKVCEALRDRGISTPIMVLTGVDDTGSCVQLLNSGADDYLTKPFDGAELNARLMALVRRQTHGKTNGVLMVRDLEIDVARRRVQRSGVTISLRRKEFDILQYLVSNRGRAVSREMIMNHAWENGRDSWNNTVDVHIKHLRDKVDRPFQDSIIKTAYGIGYMVEDTEKD